MRSKRTISTRDTYRHGDLRRSLVDAGLELARTGGPNVVVLREATRRAGVVPNAAYRHFANREDLLAAVRDAALGALARAIEAEIAAQDSGTSEQRAVARFRAVGTGYLGFATREPNLFRTAFCVPGAPRTAPKAERSGASGRDPFELLGDALDGMVAAGALPAARRPDAEYLAWSAVHGLATLLVDGPLRGMDPARHRAIGDRLVAMVMAGL